MAPPTARQGRMSRRPRLDTVLPDHPHHVIVRGNNRRNLFSYKSCYRAFLGLVAHASRVLALPVHALVLMRNHAHIVATPHDASHLSGWVKHFAQRYAARRNRHRESSGKLFEQRFTAIPITSERQLAATIPYVELNPVRAGVVEAPSDWRWSTYRLHAVEGDADPEVAELWTPHAWWQDLASDHAARGEAYRDLARHRDEAARAAAGDVSLEYAHRIERPDRSSAADGDRPVYRRTRT